MNNLINKKFYPNQKQIVINRERVIKGSTKRAYLVAYQDNLINAMNMLSGTAFRVYLCMIFNCDQYSTEFSPEYISSISGMCPASCRKSFKELQENGYIEELDSTHYLFFEIPKQHFKLNPYEEKREFVDNDNGEIHILTFKELTAIVGDDNAFSMWKEAKIYEPKTEL